MEVGATAIIINIEGMEESLYDMLNQHYTVNVHPCESGMRI